MDSIPFAMILSEIAVFLMIPILVVILFNVWVHYKNLLFLKSIEWVLLEIVPPKEVHKSPEAMELVLNALYGGGFGNWYERYWKGELAQYYSLEIVSIEGKIHYYVRIAKKFKKVFEAQLYSQYPQAQVIETVTDYVNLVPDFKKNWDHNMFGYNVELAKDEVYPIKSYIDFGMDRSVGSLDENQKIDPMSPMLEIMGSIGIGEQIWFQINMRQDMKRFTIKDKDGKEEGGQSWKKKADEVVDGLRKKVNPPDKDGKITFNTPSKGQLLAIEAIERNKNKNAFECGIRVIYVAKKEHSKGDSIGAFTAMLRAFASDDLNSFKLSGLTKPDAEPWKDIFGKELFKKKLYMLDDYKTRSFF
jgi:hypothetical protein